MAEPVESYDSFSVISDVVRKLSTSLFEQESRQPLPEGWYYRRTVNVVPGDDAWQMTVTSVPARAVTYQED